MSLSVTDPAFWADRVHRCGGDLQRAMYDGSAGDFAHIHRQQQITVQSKSRIRDTDSILDVGCGYGRLLTMLPATWVGRYVGIDISPEFVALARIFNPGRAFLVGDAKNARAVLEAAGELPTDPNVRIDVAVCVWVRRMLVDNGKVWQWEAIRDSLRRVARRTVVIW